MPERMSSPLPENHQPPRYAVVAPHAARWILTKLKAAKVGGGVLRSDAIFTRAAGHAAWADELEQGWQQLLAAAHSAPTTERGSAEVADAEEAGGSDQVVTTKDAAAVLGISERRVRQKLEVGDLQGRKAGRTWLVEHSLDDLRQCRRR